MKKVLAIDVGGTKIAAALVDENLNLDQLRVAPTSQVDLQTQIFELIAEYVGFEAIGLAMPGQVLPDGQVTKLTNVANFKSINLKEVLEDKFKVPVQVANDAKAFAFAEANIGHGKDHKTTAAVILGTGVGVGFTIEKQIYWGKDGVAGEIDHFVMPDGKLFRDYIIAAKPFKDAVAAQNYLRSLISFIVLGFNPDIIILGGGWSNLSGLSDLANRLAVDLGNYENQTPVKISEFEYPSLIGAALLALK